MRCRPQQALGQLRCCKNAEPEPEPDTSGAAWRGRSRLLRSGATGYTGIEAASDRAADPVALRRARPATLVRPSGPRRMARRPRAASNYRVLSEHPASRDGVWAACAAVCSASPNLLSKTWKFKRMSSRHEPTHSHQSRTRARRRRRPRLRRAAARGRVRARRLRHHGHRSRRASKVDAVKQGTSYIPDVPTPESRSAGEAPDSLRATSDFSVVAALDTINICVPTPLRKTKDPDMSYIVSAVEGDRHAPPPRNAGHPRIDDVSGHDGGARAGRCSRQPG